MKRRGLHRRYGRSHEARLAALPSSFERGWIKAIGLFKSGLTLALITHKADKEWQSQAFDYSRGMVASVEAMDGRLEVARREARAHGVPDRTMEMLISHARAV